MTSPLEKYNKENESRWEVLSDIPAWEEDRVLNWIKGVTFKEARDEWSNVISKYNPNVLAVIQRKERIIFSDLGILTVTWSMLHGSLLEVLQSNPERLILVLETLVKYVRDNANGQGEVDFFSKRERKSDVLGFLEDILGNGSKWRVVTTPKAKAGLEERTSEELTDVAKSLANNDLTDAWNYAFGRETDAKLAIEKAQNAIEYFATKTGLTKVKTSVYGNLLADIKAHPDKYESAAVVQFAEQDNAHNGTHPDGTLNDMMATWFWNTMNLIQKTNVIRHKNSDNDGYVIPIAVARQAVLMATLLCEFIEKEYFKKGDHRPTATEPVEKPAE